MIENDQEEFRLKSGNKIMEYIRKFSVTEKVIFGIFVLFALVSAFLMVIKISNYFKVEVPAYGGEVREGLVGLPRTINPVLAVTDTDRDLSTLIYSGLMKYKDGTLFPDIAQSYSISDNGLTYDFKIRSDIHFQDGEDLTADDIEFTVQKIQNPALKSPRRSDWDNVTIKKVSPTEIQFILKQPYSPFLNNTTLGILPKHAWEKVSDDQFIFNKYNTEPIGTGPYEIKSVNKDTNDIPSIYALSTWSGYKGYGNIPFVTNISVNFFADTEKALVALGNGTIDSLGSIPTDTVKKLASDIGSSHKIVSSPLPRIFGVFFNQNQSPVLADKIVRQALDISADRSRIVSDVLNGYGVAIYGPLPHDLLPNTSYTNGTSSVNILAAQAILEKNGWKKNAEGIYAKKNTKSATTTTLSFEIYTADSAELKQVAEIVKDSWTKLGAKVTVRIFESSDLYQNIIRTRKYDALLFGEQIGKEKDLYAFWHSSQRNAPGLNVAMYTNLKADKILEDIREVSDKDKLSDDFVAFDQVIHDDIPAVFLYSPDFIYAIPNFLHGVNINTISTPSDRWETVNSWYINTEKVWKMFANN